MGKSEFLRGGEPPFGLRRRVAAFHSAVEPGQSTARRRPETLGLYILAIFILVALLAPVLAPYDPHALTGQPLERPSAAHLLGTNDTGQDILSHRDRIGRTMATSQPPHRILLGRSQSDPS